MDLTPENKEHIDNLSYEKLLCHWRFAPSNNEWLQGETGDYWSQKMKDLRIALGDAECTKISEYIGWKY